MPDLPMQEILILSFLTQIQRIFNKSNKSNYSTQPMLLYYISDVYIQQTLFLISYTYLINSQTIKKRRLPHRPHTTYQICLSTKSCFSNFSDKSNEFQKNQRNKIIPRNPCHIPDLSIQQILFL